MLLNDGGIATYDSAHSTATSLVFDYAVPSNQGTKSLSVIGLELPSPNSIEDLASNNADLSKAGANIGLKVNSITTAPAPITVSNTQEAEIFGASSENVSFVAGAGGTLKLDQAQSFTGNIQGFAAGDTLDLANLAFGPNTTLGFRPTASGGVLTVTNATQAAHIAVLGVYTASSFALASDGHGGTALSIPSTTAPTQLIANPLHA
jgi:hypothetical protein